MSTQDRDREIAAAAEEFTRVWEELAVTLPVHYDCTMQCEEAEALAALFRAVGKESVADEVLDSHAAYDRAGERHYTGSDDGPCCADCTAKEEVK